MKIIMFFLTFILTTLAFADSVKIEVNPLKPVAGETFQIIFKIQTESSDEPEILFTPLRMEVVGKNRQGVSTRTMYSNGKLTITREMIYSYDMIAGNAGISGLRDIQVTIEGKVLKHPSMNVTILKEAEVLPEVFVMAEVSKKQLYVGEGIVARYYIYARTSVNQLDVKKYPKLNNSLKRFLQEPERTERVAVNGEPYNRSQIYAAKLFPEKPGKLKIDPLTMSVVYISAASNNSYGFGYGPRDQKTKTVSSEQIEIDVLPLPEEGRPAGFSGLVGKHDFNLTVGNTKLIVNEPLELKLTVSGNGALENYEAPKLFSNAALEEFESNSDLKLVNSEQGIKTFDYTYLAKNNLKLPATSLVMSYFDPDKKEYVKSTVSIPEIVIAGGQEASVQKDDKKQEKEEDTNPQIISMPKVPTLPSIQAPDFFQAMNWLSRSYFVLIGLIILVVILFVAMIRLNNPLKGLSLKNSQDIPSSLKKSFDIAEFYHWMAPWVEKTGKTPGQIIAEGDLSEDSKRYFVDLIQQNSYKSFGKGTSSDLYKFERKHFNRLAKMLEHIKDESHSSFRRD